MKKILSLALALIGCQPTEKQSTLTPETIRDIGRAKVTDSLRQKAFADAWAYEGAEAWIESNWYSNGPLRLPTGAVFRNGKWEELPFDSMHPLWKKYEPYYEVLKKYEESSKQ